MSTDPVPPPCSRCGSRTPTPACPRCKLRQEVLLKGSAAERLTFEQEEAERLSRLEHTVPWDREEKTVPLDVALVGSGVPLKRVIALVGCGKAKLQTDEKVQAKDLYIGNPFRLSFKYAMETADDVHILSALHGLVHPYELLAPYDFSMAQMLISEQRRWGKAVVHALKAAYPLQRLRLVFYAGMHYFRPITEALAAEDLDYWEVENPLAGLGLFERNRWLKEKLDGLARSPDR